MERISHWLKRIEDFLDQQGKGAWIAAFVVGFILFWPIGLLILGYTLWSGRMGCWSKRRKHAFRSGGTSGSESGNAAIDEYREETLRRLQEEQTDFEGFLGRLRRAKDKAQFDQFMHERRDSGRNGEPETA
jgi:hypothetical protein